MSTADADLINEQAHDADGADDSSEVVERNGVFYAARAVRNVPRDTKATAEEPGDSSAGIRAYNPFRFLSSFEKEHFHPLNVTPDRPCTAFFRADSQETSKSLFD